MSSLKRILLDQLVEDIEYYDDPMCLWIWTIAWNAITEAEAEHADVASMRVWWNGRHASPRS